jgi:hypothetical protein
MTNENGNKAVLPEPKRGQVGQTDSGLVEIEVFLRKYHLWVFEGNGLHRFRVSSLVTETLKKLDDPQGIYDEIIRQNMITEVWAPLFVSSRGEVPDMEQFLALPAVDLAFWVDTARELGHEFEWLDGLERAVSMSRESAQEDVKKKSRANQNNPDPVGVGAE